MRDPRRLRSPAVLQNLSFLDDEPLQLAFTWMSHTGLVAFTFLPVLFAMAIPLGLAREDKGVAAFSGFVGSASMNLAVNFFLTTRGVDFEDKGEIAHYGIADVLGVKSIDTGLLGAVAVGVIVMSVVGLLVPLVWPTLGSWIASVGTGIAHAGVLGPFFFGMGEVLLRPLGLHHILVVLFRFTDACGAGVVCGENVSGALNIFYAQLSCPTPSGAAHTATQFLPQGKMAAYLGGLPGAALAMYHCAERTMRPEIKALLVSAVLGVYIGNTDGNIIDLLVFGVLQGTTTTPPAAYAPAVLYQLGRILDLWSSPGDGVVVHTPAYDAFPRPR